MDTNIILQLEEITHLKKQILSSADQSFAVSLVGQYAKKSMLSKGQWPWVKILVERATQPSLFDANSTKSVGDFEGVINLFLKAKKHLKWPRVHLETEAGDPIQLSMAGERARYPGTINVTDGGSYGSNIWYGRVNTQGDFQSTDHVTPEITELLTQLANNPHLAAHFHGKKTSNCCFCNKDLMQANSVAAGYGPVCAKNWGLKDEWNAAVKKMAPTPQSNSDLLGFDNGSQ